MHRNREYNTKTKILDVPFDLIIFLGIMVSTSKNYQFEMSLEASTNMDCIKIIISIINIDCIQEYLIYKYTNLSEEYIYIMFHISR